MSSEIHELVRRHCPQISIDEAADRPKLDRQLTSASRLNTKIIIGVKTTIHHIFH